MNLYPQTALIIAEKRTALDTNALKTLVLVGGNLGVERSIFNIGAQNAADFKFLADLRIDGGFICQHKFQTLHTAGAYVRDDDIMVGKPRHVPELFVVGSADAKALAEKLVGRAGQILRVGIRHGGAHGGQVGFGKEGVVRRARIRGRAAGGQEQAEYAKQNRKRFFHDHFPFSRPRMEKMRNARRFAATMVAPTGVDARMENRMPEMSSVQIA